MNTGRNRTFSICLSDIPTEEIVKHKNGKLYLNLTSFDYDERNQHGNDFSISLPLNEDQKAAREKGETIQRTFLGNGRIWEDKTNTKPATTKDIEDLPF